ncbi:MAG: biopolymer transporter ExbD [Ignavibacteria bacterium]|nr:biopolymer transporter ExbD [Ignavibacteria bacterium]
MKFQMTNQKLQLFSYSSLTDIVMLLLIFFLLTSQFVINTGVKVQLPGAKQNEQTVPSKLVVTIDLDGNIFVGSEGVSIDKLPGKLEEIKAVSNESMLIIRADKTVALDFVINVIDAAKGVGLEKFTIETEKLSY